MLNNACLIEQNDSHNLGGKVCEEVLVFS